MSITLNILSVIDDTPFIAIHFKIAYGHWENHVATWLQYFISINFNVISPKKNEIQEKRNC